MRFSAALLLALVGCTAAFAQNTYKVELTIRDTNESAKAGRHYTILVDNGTKGVFKIGNRVPVATGAFQPGTGGAGINPMVNTQYTYVDVGVNIECTVTERGSGVGLRADVDLSMVAPPEKGAPPVPNPTITQIKFSTNSDLPLGKPTMVTSVDDPVTMKRFEVDATITKMN